MSDNPMLIDKTWRLVQTELEERLDSVVGKLGNPDANYKQIVQYQAQLALLKDLLNLPEQIKLRANRG